MFDASLEFVIKDNRLYHVPTQQFLTYRSTVRLYNKQLDQTMITYQYVDKDDVRYLISDEIYSKINSQQS